MKIKQKRINNPWRHYESYTKCRHETWFTMVLVGKLNKPNDCDKILFIDQMNNGDVYIYKPCSPLPSIIPGKVLYYKDKEFFRLSDVKKHILDRNNLNLEVVTSKQYMLEAAQCIYETKNLLVKLSHF